MIARCSGSVEHIYFNDDEFLLDPGHLVRMAGVARDLGLQICFQTRTRDVVNFRDVIEDNRDAILQVHLGVESFSQAQLDRWSKRVTVDVNLQALQVLSELGVSYYPYIILSDAQTSPDELAETCEGLLEMPDCPYSVRRNGWDSRAVVSPVEKGLHLNRMKTFRGELERSPDTRYLDLVWQFIWATHREAGLLSDLYVYSQADLPSPTSDAHPSSGRLRGLLRGRIGLIADVARGAYDHTDDPDYGRRIEERAEEFNRESKDARVRYMVAGLDCIPTADVAPSH